MSLYRQAFWKLLELGLIPDYYVRSKVRNGLIDQIKDMNQDGNVETAQDNLNKFIEEIKTMPIAINQSNANDQHYEVPSEFYVKVLGSYLKYSCGLWPNDDTTLEESELEMLKLYCQRADLKKGQTVLDLGCGWGSVALYVAENYPESNVYALSNSSTQKKYIMDQASAKGLENLTVFTGDVSVFENEDWSEKFDRVISIEMFEHMKNYEALMSKISTWMTKTGKLFVHIFTHQKCSYHFNKGWMAKTFFTGGTMPSHDLLLHFQRDLKLEKRWSINGQHYAKTLDAWLARMDSCYNEVWPILQDTYGKENAARWYVNWRMFFIVCSETFGYNQGNEWTISHYCFKKSE